MSTGVERWAELRDREAVGEALTDQERAECEGLEGSDMFVRAQAAPLRELSRMLDRATRERPTPTDRDLVDRALRAVRVSSGQTVPGSLDADGEIERAVDPEGPRWVGATAAGITIALSAAAAIALMLYEPQPVPSSGPVTAQTTAPALAPTVVELAHARTAARGQRLFRAGAVLPFNTELVEGDRVESGSAPGCLVVDPGVDVCLAAGSEIKLVSLSRHGRAIEVQRGLALARLDAQVRGDGFELRAGALRALAQGTVYSLERSGDDALRVRVLEGRVKVLAAESVSELHDAQVATYRSTERGLTVDALLPAQATRLWELLQSRTTSVEAADKPALLAASPVGDTTAPLVEPARQERPEPSPQFATTDARTRLREAWEQLKAKRWSDAAASYATILHDFPKSDEAHVVLVRLGDLQLDHLEQPGEALASYERYLREGGGPLEAEARYGLIQAQSRLGRAGAERAAIEDFLAKHPTSLKAAGLRERLRTLPR